MSAFLDVRDLAVDFSTESGVVRAVDGVSFGLDRGQTLALVGESGCGKSTTAAAIMGFLGGGSTSVSGQVVVGDDDILSSSPRRLRQLRGNRVAIVFQDPLSALHPCYTVGRQLVEAVRIHQDLSKRAARNLAIDMLGRVGIPDPRRRFGEYPHQFSGGMRQRVMIAMALINGPELLIADEPTTALDVTVQAQIMELLASLQQELRTAMLLITHDLGIVARAADEVCVMYGGRVVERGTVREVFYQPQMPYTWGLLQSLPRLDVAQVARLPQIPGQPPTPSVQSVGCRFRDRCGFDHLVADGRCGVEAPALRDVGGGHLIRCHLTSELRDLELTPSASGSTARRTPDA
jgi:peptide/nickel transport system ATP-binding protein